MDARKDVVVVEDEPKVLKRVAKDGTKRGLHMQGRKKPETLLIQKIQDAIVKDTGIVDWHPVVHMAVVSARAYSGYPAVDEEGRAILDGDGNQVMVPPDMALSVAAAAKVAPYVSAQIRPKDDVSEDKNENDPDETREQIIAALDNMGVDVTIPRDE